MNFTFQTYIKKGISKDLVVKQLDILYKQAITELQQRKGEGITLDQTKAGIKFNDLKKQFGVDIYLTNFKEKEVQLDKFVNAINATIKSKRLFVTDLILPQIELFSNKLSCNPHQLIALFLRVGGFTGTLWNSESMSGALKACRNREPMPRL